MPLSRIGGLCGCQLALGSHAHGGRALQLLHGLLLLLKSAIQALQETRRWWPGAWAAWLV